MLFIQTLFSNPTRFFMVTLIVIFSVCLHEFFHAWMAFREGDYTAEDHLTLNPLKQMGFMSLIMLALVGIAWGGVPVRHELLKSKRSLLKIALAGPAANLLLLLIAWLLLFVLLLPPVQNIFNTGNTYKVLLGFIFLFGTYNFVLLAFNLIPAPGLDGWTVLSELFPKLKTVSSEWVKGAMLLIMLLAFVGVRFLFMLGEWVMYSVLLLANLFAGA